MKNEQITILVATKNKVETIKMCIDSLLSLNHKPERILILDGGSTDETYEILQEYGSKIDLKQFPNTGLSWRINWALDNTDTKYLAMTDADCVVEPDWLDELLTAFRDGEPGEKIVATAGYCGTPKDVSLLQKLIGYEMDNRFKRLPKYIFRAPTMSLCLKTDIARQVKFDEKQLVAVETDFGFRLSQYGKILYTKKSKVWHYHRSSLRNYFNQQKSQSKWAFKLIFRHKKRAVSDPITSLSMTAQIPLLFLTLFFALFSFIFPLCGFIALFFAIPLFLIYTKNIIEINPPLYYYPLLFAFFIFRTTTWVIGVSSGAILMIKIFFKQNIKE